MTEETKLERPDAKVTPSDNKGIETAAPKSNEGARIGRPTDRRSIRRAEIKKQKRRAHRRKINAANTPG